MKKYLKKVRIFIMMILTGVIFGSIVLNVNAVAQTISLGSGVKLPAYLAGVSFKTKVTT